jgi:fructan beta-fructosidase
MRRAVQRRGSKPGRRLLQAVVLTGALNSAAASAATEQSYHELFRPQLHFTPAEHWMNDPNGMLYVDGEYHLFYQYHPYSNRWGPMHWGHAVSRDLVRWQHLPIALQPDERGAIFSGSAVFDRDNTSGLGTKAQPPMVAVFTYHDHEAEKRGSIAIESQGLAYSHDRGRTWIKYGGNPIVANPGIRHFRDPKVFWFAGTQRWIMTLASEDHVKIYSSRDLKRWRHESDFGIGWGAHGGVWECPDLFEMPVEGENTRRFVLLSSVNPGAPNGGSGTQYFVDRFDGRRFTLDDRLQQRLRTWALWLDHGADNYAGVTWSGVPTVDGRRLFLGWMSNWDYAQDVPTERWRSAMTLPRALRLIRTARGLQLRSMPVIELASLRQRSAAIPARLVQARTELVDPALRAAGQLELELVLALQSAENVRLIFRNEAGDETLLRVNRAQHRYELDRSRSGVVGFNDRFSRLQTAPIAADAATLTVRVVLDHSSVEIFLNDGETVLTSLVFPRQPYNSVLLEADGAVSITSGSVHELGSIWNEPDLLSPAAAGG